MFVRNASRVPLPQRTTAPLRSPRAVAGSALITPISQITLGPHDGRRAVAICSRSKGQHTYRRWVAGCTPTRAKEAPESNLRGFAQEPLHIPVAMVPDIGTPFVDQPI
jgi:hypothetical protein